MNIQWHPSDGILATNELMDIITCDESIAILAGAGTGKTELLAQKANYLFFTDKCLWPKRILALTFKTEAQQNIKSRINKRCGQKSNRFDSFTFHAFCKSIVDRFKNTLPEESRPKNNYDIVFTRRDANGLDKVLIDDLLSLAVDILKNRPDIRDIICYSYSYVFVDEFQDTTDKQYELIKILFKGTDTKVLVVGDLYQSIMLWAGARKTVFSDFQTDFSAVSKFLAKNYRASDEMQNVLDVVLNYIKNPSGNVTELLENPSKCFFYVFSDEYQEANYIVDDIKSIIASGVSESEVCILTKVQSSKYTEIVRDKLFRSGINNLDMTDLQDVLSEPLGKLFTLFLKALIIPDPKVMTELYEINLTLNKVEIGDDKESELTNKLIGFISIKKKKISDRTTVDELLSFMQDFIGFLGLNKIKGRWKQYKSPEYYNLSWKKLEIHLRNMCDQAETLAVATRLFNAENSVQIMNIHKCKGLEYHTVFFLGLEDEAFWNYGNEPFENNCAIYVALSRAKDQLRVTYSKYREHRYSHHYDRRSSSYKNIRPIIDLLIKKCKFTLVNDER